MFAGDDKNFNAFLCNYVETILGMKPDLKTADDDSDDENDEEEDFINQQSMRATMKSGKSSRGSTYKAAGQLHMKYGIPGANNNANLDLRIFILPPLSSLPE